MKYEEKTTLRTAKKRNHIFFQRWIDDMWVQKDIICSSYEEVLAVVSCCPMIRLFIYRAIYNVDSEGQTYIIWCT